MNEDGRDYLRKQFDFERWFGRNRMDENLLIWRYTMSKAELPEWQPERIQLLEPSPELRAVLESRAGAAVAGWSRATHSIWRPAGGGGLINVDIYECETRQQAHELLLRLLGEFQSPLTLLHETDQVGDVAFTNEDDTVVLFARANLVTLARNANPTRVPITEAIKGLDERFAGKPPASAERKIPALRRWPATKKGKASATVRLAVEPAPETAEPTWYKVFVPDGEIRIDQGNLVYKPPSSGVRELTVFEINPGGEPAKQTVRLVAE